MDANLNHWSVTVAVDGDDVLTISHNHLAGKDGLDDLAPAIRTAAAHLLCFIGAGKDIVGGNVALAPADAAQAPTAWVRFRSDGGFEGPIMNSDTRICDTRRTCGAWTPLYAAPVAPAAVAPKTMPEIFDALAQLKTDPALIEQMKACMEVFSPNEAVIGPYHVFEAGRRAIRAAKHDQVACSLVNGRGSKCTCDAADTEPIAPSLTTDAGAVLPRIESILASEIECSIFEEHVQPALRVAEKALAEHPTEQRMSDAATCNRGVGCDGLGECFAAHHGGSTKCGRDAEIERSDSAAGKA